MKAKQFFNFHRRNLLTAFLLITFIISLSSVSWSGELFHPGGKITILQIISAFLKPDLSPETIEVAIEATWKTIAYAVTGMSIALIIAIILGVLASGVLVKSEKNRVVVKTVSRLLLGSMRAIHELIWAWFFLACIGLSPFAAIFSLAIPYGGALGRVFADIISDVPKEPIRALESSGASRIQVLIYGYLPMALVDMISYTMYRFECAIRSSTIMSFIGLGGLGHEINLSLADLRYNQVWTYVFFLVGIVVLVDLWSNLLRRRLTV